MTDPQTKQLDAAIEVVRQATAAATSLPALGDEQLAQLRAYLEVLLLWRRATSLIATSDPVEIAEHHILDSLHVASHVAPRRRLADLGSGAGLPGIPLAVALPSLQVCLLESRRRKANFLREARRRLGLVNVEVVEGRAEDVRTKLDAVVCRAVGPLTSFLDLAATLLEPGGVAVAMKGPAESMSAEVHPGFGAGTIVHYDLARGRRRALLLYPRR